MKRVMAVVLFALSAVMVSGQTTFTATTSGNWDAIVWTKTGIPSAALYPGQPGYESEVHDVDINGVGIMVTLNTSITSSVRNVGLISGTLEITSNTLTMLGNLSGAGTLTLTTGKINIAGNNSSTGTFTAGTGTINYNGGTQIVRGTAYHNLEISGNNIKTFAADATVNNNLDIISGTLDLAGSTIDVTGTTTILSGGTLTSSAGPTRTLKNLTLTGGTITAVAPGVRINITGNLLVNNVGGESVMGRIQTTITGTTTINAGSTLRFSSITGNKTLVGNILINGSWLNSANESFNIRGGIEFNGTTFTSGTGSYSFNTSGSQSVTGTKPMTFSGPVIVTAPTNLTNLNNVTVAGTLTGTGTWSNGNGAVLNIANSAAPAITGFVVNTATNTVNYNFNGAQTIRAAAYYNLGTAVAGRKTLAGAISADGNIAIGGGTILDVTASNFPVTLKGNWSNAGSFDKRTGTVTLNGTGPQSINNTASASESFYNLVLNSDGPVTVGLPMSVDNTLTMTKGVIIMPGKVLTLGLSGALPGVLNYTAGWINGTFSRWLTSVDNGVNMLFPVGSASTGNNMTLNFLTIVNSGKLDATFISTPPVLALPLSEGGFSFNQLFPEGYWNLTKDATFAYTGTYDLKVIPAGFTTYPITGDTRIVSKYNSGNWFFNGTHAAGSSSLLLRNQFTSYIYNYAVAYAETCTSTLTACPSDIVVNNAPGACGSNVTWTAPTLSPACPGHTITSDYNPGDFFNTGTTTVTYNHYSGAILVESCSFKVTVNDSENPVAICKDISLNLDASGNATLIPADIDGGSGDNCSFSLSADKTNFTCADVGSTIPVVLTVSDPSGNTSSCTSNVTILDVLPPTVITKTFNLVLDASGNATLNPSDVDNGTYDNCSTPTLTVAPNTFTCADQGTKTVLFTAVDASGNTSTQNVDITVSSSLAVNSISLSSCDLVSPYALYKSDITGGAGSYTYLWDGLDDTVDPFFAITGAYPFLSFTNTSVAQAPYFNNLMPDGNYTIRLTVTDLAGCSATGDLVINKSGPLFDNVSSIKSDACDGGTVTYTVNPDPDATFNWGVENGTILSSAPYSNAIDVLWTPGSATGVVIATIIKTDLAGNRCESSVVDSVSIYTAPTPLFSSPALDACSGVVSTYTLTDFYSNYAWTVTGGVITAGGTVGSNFVSVRWGTGAAGKVSVSVENGTGCAGSVFVDVNIFNVSGSVTSQIDVKCNGDASGEVVITPSGSGAPPYEYSLDGNPYQSSNSFSGLPSGDHLVTIRDSKFCTYDVVFKINEPPLLKATITHTDVACFGNSTGTITASGSGGVSPYEYSKDGTTFVSSGSFINLAAGSYTITVRDANMCFLTQNINIIEPATALSATITSQTNVTCSGGSDGSVTIDGSGGTAPYEYQLDAGTYQSSGIFNSLGAGNYNVTVRDSKLCTVIVPVTITEPPLLVATASTNSPVCEGNSLDLIGGPNGMVTYSWTGPNGFISGLQSPNISAAATTAMAGVYTLQITNGAGCTATTTTSVIVTPTPNASFTYAASIFCSDEADPSPLITGTAGTFSSGAGLVINAASGVIDLSASAAGNYTVTNTVSVGGGCTDAIATYDITITTLPTAVISYSGSPWCSSAGVQPVTLTGTSGGVFSAPAGLDINSATGMITPATSIPGSYTVTYTIAAAGGCGIVTATTDVTVTALPTASISYSGSPFCKSVVTSQPVTLTGTTGGIYSASPSGLSLNTSTGAVNPSLSTAGTYNIMYTIAAAGGCSVVTANTNVTITNVPVATFSYSGTPYCTGEPNPSPTFGAGATAGNFTSAAGLVFVSAATGQVDLAASTPGTYTVINTIDAAGGCAMAQATSDITITALPVASISYSGSPWCSSSAVQNVTLTGTSGGTYTSSPTGLSLNASTGTITPSTSTAGTYIVTYTISAAGGCPPVTSTATVVITEAPSATISYPGSPFCKSLIANQAVTLTGTGSYTGGTFTASPGGLSLNASTGAITPSTSTAGNYVVTYTIPATGGCAASPVTANVTITEVPSATISYGTPFCKSLMTGQPVTLSGTGLYTGGTFSAAPSGLSLDPVTGSIVPGTSTAATYTVTYKIAASGGCGQVTTTTNVVITAIPTATINYTGSPYCTDLTSAPVILNGTGAYLFGTYSSTAGLSINAASGEIDPSSSTGGTYTVTYTVPATGGCAAVPVTNSVTITDVPTATISYSGAPFCKSINTAQPVTISGTGAYSGGVFSSSAGLSINSSSGAITPSASTAGTYTVTYTIPPSGGCTSVVVTTSVTVTDAPTATISYSGTPFCTSVSTAQSVSLTGTGLYTGGTFTSTGGLTIDAATGAITPSTSISGTYTVTYTTLASGGCSSLPFTTSVTVTDVPTATISYAGEPFCKSLSTAQSVTLSGTGAYSGGTFSASPSGLSINSSTGAITPSASTAGTYTVTYTTPASGGCTSVPASTSVNITAVPAATISYAGTPFCQSLLTAQPVSLSGSGAYTGGTFTAPAGLIIDASTGAITPSSSTPGTYIITYTIPASGGCASIPVTTSVTVTAVPTATISYAGTPFCKSIATAQPVSLSGSGAYSGGTFTASAGGLTIDASTGAITPSSSTAGTYTVTYTIPASGGCPAAPVTTSVTITAVPAATISYAGTPFCKSIVSGQSVSLSGSGVYTGGTYTASPGGLTIDGSTGSITPSSSTAGTYTVTYTIPASGGCAAIPVTTSVTITTVPTATISYTGTPFCKSITSGQPVTLTGTGSYTGGTYNASPGGLSIDASTGAITPSTSSAGTYTVTYTIPATGGCPANPVTTSVVISDIPAAIISYAGSPFCKTVATAQPVSLSGSGAYTGGTFTATPGGLTIDGSTGAIIPSTSTQGNYTITYTIPASGGCASVPVTTTVTITDIPAAAISYGTPFCKSLVTGQSVSLSGTTGGTFSAAPSGLNIDPSTGSIIPGLSNAATYTVTYTIPASGGCGQVNATTNVVITAIPTATISYAGSPYCNDLVSGLVTLNGTGAYLGGNYVSTAGLSIDATTGELDPSASTAGTYTVTYTVPASGGCAPLSTTTSVIIDELPTVSLSYPATDFCKSSSVQSATLTGTGPYSGGTFTVSPSGLTIDASTGAITPSTSNPGSYTITYSTPASGCSIVTTTASVNITDVPAATINYAGTPFCKSVVTAQSVSLTGTGAYTGGTFTASAGGLTIDASTGAITPSSSNAGTYIVTYTIPASGGCTSVPVTTSVIVTDVPTATISYSGTPYCKSVSVAQSVTLSGTGTYTGGTFSASPAGLSIDASTGAILPSSSAAGTYTVTYTIPATGGCAAIPVTTTVTITVVPTATISYAGDPFCKSVSAPQPVTITGTGVYTGGIFSALPAGLSIDGSTGAITPSSSSPGTYTVTYDIPASGGCASVPVTTSITINVVPTVSISYAGTPYCQSIAAAQSVTISGTGLYSGGTYSVLPSGLSINASTGAITPSTSQSGSYTVTYTTAASGGCAPVTATAPVTITATPTVSISYATSPFCSTVSTPQAVTLTGTGAITGGTFAALTGGITIDPSSGEITPSTSTPGTYTVVYTTIASGGCTSVTANTDVTITALPTASISYVQPSFCSTVGAGQAVIFTGTSGGTYTSLPSGLNLDATTGSIDPSLSTPDNYTVTYTIAAAGGCSAVTATTSVNIVQAPAATIDYAGAPFCKSDAGAKPVTLTGTTGGVYSSTAGLTIDLFTGDITPSTSAPATYLVRYTIAAAGGCSTLVAQDIVTITATPTATISYAGAPFCKSVSAAQSVTLSGTGTYSGGIFSASPAGLSIDASTGAIIPSSSTAGTYTVTYTIPATGGCAAIPVTTLVTITDVPTATISYAGTPFCKSVSTAQSVTITGTGVYSGGIFSALPAGLSIDGSTGAITPSSSSPGTYTVTYDIPASGGCASVPVTTTITVNAVPTVSISYSGTPYCQSIATAQTATLSGTGLYLGGIFSASPSGLSIDASTGAIVPSTSTAGNYVVTYTTTVTSGCVPVTATASVTITTAPTAGINYAGAPFCSTVSTPQSVTLTGTGAYTSGTYTALPAGLTIDASTGAITPSTSAPGAYTVTYTIPASGGCSTITATTNITITTLPSASISYAQTSYCSTVGAGQAVILTGTSGGTYTASPSGLNLDAITGAIDPSLSTPANYTITYSLTSGGGCSAVTATTTVNVVQAPFATIDYAGKPFCKSDLGGKPVTLAGTTGGVFSSTAGLTIDLFTGDITPSTSAPATYLVRYTIAAAGGCSTFTAQKSVTITAAPTAAISYAGEPFCQSVSTARTVTLTGSGAYTGGIFSAAPTGLSIDATTGAIIPSSSTAGTYTITYTTPASGGCAAVAATTNITISPLPAASISYSLSTICSIGGVQNVNLTGTTGGSFSAPAGLSIDALTGAITPSASAEGTYTVIYTIAAASGCPDVTTSTSVTISDPPAPTGVAAQTFCAIDLPTVSDISVSSSGTVTWYDAATGGNALAGTATLANGLTYYAAQTIAGCESDTRFAVTVTISDPSAPTATATQTFCSINLPTVADISVTSAGTVKWYDASTGGNIVPGTTTLTNGSVYFASQVIGGCESILRVAVTATVSDPPAPTGATSQTFCSSDLPDLSDMIITSSGTTIWYDAPSGGTVLPIATLLSDGTTYYASQVTGGCESVSRLAVTSSLNPASNGGSISGAGSVCNGNNSTLLTLSSYTGKILNWEQSPDGLTWTPIADTLSTYTAVNLITTTYYRAIVQSGICSAANSGVAIVTVNPNPALTFVQTDPVCNGGLTGSIDITATGGTAPYNYTWTGTGVIAGNEDQSGLAAGTYTVSLTDGNGCNSSVSTITLNEPAALTGILSVTSPITCKGGTAVITLNASGGTAPYSYTFDGVTNATGVFSGIRAKAGYTWSISDVAGCGPFTGVSDITEPDSLVGSAVISSPILCNAGNAGLTLTATGGTTPYIYTFNGVTNTSGIFSGISAGNAYAWSVTDSLGCGPNTGVLDVTEPVALTGTIPAITNVTVYGGNDGSVEILGAGGISPYQYKIDGGTYQSSGIFGSLTAGSHTLRIQDNNLCTLDTSVSISEPPAPLTESHSSSNVTCFGTSTGSVTITAAGGVSPYEYSVNGGNWQSSGTFGNLPVGNYTFMIRDAAPDTIVLPIKIFGPSDPLGLNITPQNVLCFGGSSGSITAEGTGGVAPYQYRIDGGTFQDSGSFSSLVAGTHVVEITDFKLCSFSANVIISEPSAALSGTILTQSNITCNGAADGSVIIEGTGGTLPYSYNIDGGSFQTTGKFTALLPGSHSLSIRDANMCSFGLTVDITEPQTLAVNASTTDVQCPGEPEGTISLSITGGTQPYKVIWGDNGSTTKDRINVKEGEYSAVIVDTNSCAIPVNIKVGVVGTETCLVIPEIITPNNDGFNDTWKIKNIDLFPDAEIIVFNRWGKKVFETKNISANPWNGTFKGESLPTDSYHYILDLNREGLENRTGVISIIK